MINAQVVSEYNLWKKNIINPEIYFKKKLKKLTKFKPFNFSSKTFTILLTSNNKMNTVLFSEKEVRRNSSFR